MNPIFGMNDLVWLKLGYIPKSVSRVPWKCYNFGKGYFGSGYAGGYVVLFQETKVNTQSVIGSLPLVFLH